MRLLSLHQNPFSAIRVKILSHFFIIICFVGEFTYSKVMTNKVQLGSQKCLIN